MNKVFHGYSYPFIFQNRLMWVLWKKVYCPHEIHLFDEVLSNEEHYLHCDACGHMVNIDDKDLNSDIV